jgi:peptide-methionine (S)-S-oxide reductase
MTLRTIHFLAAIALAMLLPQTAASQQTKTEAVAIFAGGCFWCVEADFDAVPGVIETISGYTGGKTANPTYRSVSRGGTGHREAVRIVYDPKIVNYERLLEVFWRSVDPTDGGGQFCDRGVSYETAIFAATPEQRRLAEASKMALEDSGILQQPIVTPIEDAGTFYRAEDYHQGYYKRNSLRYKFYRFNCRRDARLVELWGD